MPPNELSELRKRLSKSEEDLSMIESRVSMLESVIIPRAVKEEPIFSSDIRLKREADELAPSTERENDPSSAQKAIENLWEE